MIELTRLNGSPLFVNCDLIKWAEATPDTTLTLIHGEKVVVRESCSEVVKRMIAQRVTLLEEIARMIPATEALLRTTAALRLPNPQIRAIADLPDEDPDESG